MAIPYRSSSPTLVIEAARHLFGSPAAKQAERAMAWYGLTRGLVKVLGRRKARPLARLRPSDDRIAVGVGLLLAGGLIAAGVYAARQSQRRERSADIPGRASASLAIQAPTDRLYAVCRDVENFPVIWRSLESVAAVEEDGWHWRAKAPNGQILEWRTEFAEDIPGKLIAWRTTDGSPIAHRGVITFTSTLNGHGSIVRVEVEQDGAARDLDGLLRRELRELKQFVETGELATTRGQAAGRRSLIGQVLARGDR